MDSIRPSDRNRAGGAIADLVQGGVDFASRDNPPVKMLLDMFGVPGLARTLNRMSYGQPLTNASQANVPLIPQDTADAAMLAVPALAKGVGGLAKSMPQVPSLARRGEDGAIRIGGREDLALTHAFGTDLKRTRSIAETGDLKSPSLGITKDLPNQYMHDAPQFLFKAGTADVPTHGGTLINRDGYFANPTGLNYVYEDNNFQRLAVPRLDYDPQKHYADLAHHLQRAENLYGAKDLRLLQGIAGDGQSLSIAASPSFKNFAEFEGHPQGYGALKKYKPNLDEAQPAWQKLDAKMGETLDSPGFGEADVSSMYRMKNRDKPLEDWPREYRSAWKSAEDSPSAMAEWKVHGNLDVNPENAVIYLPASFKPSPFNLKSLEPLKARGFTFIPHADLKALGDPDKAFPRIAASDGTFKVPPYTYEAHPDLLDWLPPRIEK